MSGETVTGVTLEDGCRAILTSSHRRWNEGPAVYFIYRTDEFTLRDLALPRELMMSYPTPGEFLAGAARALRPAGALQPLLAPHMVGVAYRDEAYMAMALSSDVARVDQMKAAGVRGELHKFPGREEIRMVCAATRNGSLVMMSQDRAGTITVMPPAATGGSIPTKLKALVRALTRDLS